MCPFGMQRPTAPGSVRLAAVVAPLVSDDELLHVFRLGTAGREEVGVRSPRGKSQPGRLPTQLFDP